MNQSAKTIKLSGSLGKRFGVFHKFYVDSFPEAIRALSSQVEGFRDYMNSYVGQRMQFAVFVDGVNVGEHDAEKYACAREIRIIPVPTASKNGGLLQIVVGAIIMIAAFYTGGASLSAMGAMSSAAFMAGGAMVLGGVVQVLSPQPGGMNMATRESTENKPSYAFGGAVNTTAAGYPVALPYGERTNGGAIWSSGIYAEDMN